MIAILTCTTIRKRSYMKKLLTYFLVFITPLLSNPFACFGEPSIKIGAILHLTGEFAMQGAAFREGIELAVSQINHQGGINGIKMEVIFEDTQYKPIQAHTAAKRLAISNDVLATVISVITEAQAAAKILEKAQLPSIVLWDSSPELEAAGDYLFGIGPWAPASGQRSAEYARYSLNIKEAVIINTNTEWSVYVSNWFERTFKKLGGNILARYSVDPSETDFRTIITKAKNHNPAIYYVPIDSNIIPFFKQAKQLGIKNQMITSDILDKELFDEGGDLFEGILQSMSGDPNYPETKKMKILYQEKYGRQPDFLMLTAWGFDAINVIAEAIKKGGFNRQGIKNELYKIKNYQGACGDVTFNMKGSAPREVKLFRVHNKELILAN